MAYFMWSPEMKGSNYIRVAENRMKSNASLPFCSEGFGEMHDRSFCYVRGIRLGSRKIPSNGMAHRHCMRTEVEGN